MSELAEHKIGDKVVNDLDGHVYTLQAIQPRKPLAGHVTLLGNLAYLEDDDGNIVVVYEWEISPLRRSYGL
jgi:hypothetical protein